MNGLREPVAEPRPFFGFADTVRSSASAQPRGKFVAKPSPLRIAELLHAPSPLASCAMRGPSRGLGIDRRSLPVRRLKAEAVC